MTTPILITIFAVILLLIIIGIVRTRKSHMIEVKLTTKTGKKFLASKHSNCKGNSRNDWDFYTEDGDEIFDDALIYLLYDAVSNLDIDDYDYDEDLVTVNDTNHVYEQSATEPIGTIDDVNKYMDTHQNAGVVTEMFHHSTPVYEPIHETHHCNHHECPSVHESPCHHETSHHDVSPSHDYGSHDYSSSSSYDSGSSDCGGGGCDGGGGGD